MLLVLVNSASAQAIPHRMSTYAALAPGSTIVLVTPKTSLPAQVQKSVTTQIDQWQPRSANRSRSKDDDWGNLKLFGKAAPAPPSQPNYQELPAAALQLFCASFKIALNHRLRLDVLGVQAPSRNQGQPAEIARLLKTNDLVAAALPVILHVAISEKSQRRVNVWARISFYMRATNSSTLKMQLHHIDCSGTYAAPRVLFGTAYLKTRTAVLARACWGAARMAVSTLELLESSPFARPSTSVAIAPIAGPSAADLLVFAETGRRVIPSGINGLQRDVSHLMNLDLQPIMSRNVEPPSACREVLLRSRAGMADLWDGIVPNVKAALALGKQLRVKMVFLSRIVDVEASTGSDRRKEPADSAYARSVGYLLDTSNGRMLWSGVGAATMHSGVKWAGGSSSLTVVVEDAERFALSALNRKFEMYKNQFISGRMLKSKGPVSSMDE